MSSSDVDWTDTETECEKSQNSNSENSETENVNTKIRNYIDKILITEHEIVLDEYEYFVMTLAYVNLIVIVISIITIARLQTLYEFPILIKTILCLYMSLLFGSLLYLYLKFDPDKDKIEFIVLFIPFTSSLYLLSLMTIVCF